MNMSQVLSYIAKIAVFCIVSAPAYSVTNVGCGHIGSFQPNCSSVQSAFGATCPDAKAACKSKIETACWSAAYDGYTCINNCSDPINESCIKNSDTVSLTLSVGPSYTACTAVPGGFQVTCTYNAIINAQGGCGGCRANTCFTN